MERDLILGGDCTMQCADDVVFSCTLSTCMVLLINVMPINSIKNKVKKLKKDLNYVSFNQLFSGWEINWQLKSLKKVSQLLPSFTHFQTQGKTTSLHLLF